MTRVRWSRRKNRINLRKHGIDFDEAKTVLADPLAITVADREHSQDENRYLTIGISRKNRLVIMAHTLEDNIIRIITARRPTRAERLSYEEGDDDA